MNKYILLLFMGLTCSLNAQVIEIKNVRYFKQEKTEWCSAAVSQCVLFYRGITQGQCDIMNYIKSVDASFGPICCPDPPSNLPYNCNKGVDLGPVYAPASVYGILKYFGNFHHLLSAVPFEIDQIKTELQLKNPIIAQWDYEDGERVAHVVVIYGINRDNINDSIYYMDPAPIIGNEGGGLRKLPYNEFKKEGKRKWNLSLSYGGCFGAWKGDYPCPCHCYNGRWDPEYGEMGVDCGYPCPPCIYIPPDPSVMCSDCIHGGYEDGIDCGGPYCRPCSDVPEELIISYIEPSLSDEKYMALKKITTQGNLTVQSGKKVSFITEEEGTIVLRPGFKAVQNCTFTTQRKDLSEYMRDCPEKFCAIRHSIATHCTRANYPYNHPLDILRLYYAVEIKYKIYNGNEVVLDRVKKILNNGYIYLWDCQDGANGTVSYTIDYTVTYCNGTKQNYTHWFTVINSFAKSLTDTPDDPETSTSPLANNITLPIENTTTPSFVIIPNPNPGTFQIETNFSLSDITNLKIINSLGATVYETQNLFLNTIQLPTSVSGLHFVVAMLKTGTVLTQKMMVQR